MEWNSGMEWNDHAHVITSDHCSTHRSSDAYIHRLFNDGTESAQSRDNVVINPKPLIIFKIAFILFNRSDLCKMSLSIYPDVCILCIMHFGFHAQF